MTEGFVEWENITGADSAGIKFMVGNDCGKAKITITNTTDSLDIINNKIIDLYRTSESLETEYVYQISPLDPEKTYKVKLEHSGTTNDNSTDELIKIDKFLKIKELESSIEAKLKTYHSDFPEYEGEFLLDSDGDNSLIKQSVFSGDGETKLFHLPTSQHAYKPVKFSVDGGESWMYPENVNLVWGSNSDFDNYDNEVVDENGHFSVKFDNAPAVGNGNIIISWIPKIDSYQIETTIKMPQDETGFKDTRKNPRLLDYGIEFISD